MAEVVVMPKLGLTMTEGRIAKWYKKEGDRVSLGETLFEVETDKMTNEIEASAEGILRKIIVETGGMAPVTEAVGIIGTAEEDISSLLQGEVEVKEIDKSEEKVEIKPEVEVLETSSSAYKKATPYAKKLAKENNIDIENVKGNGYDGRVLGRDVLEFIESQKVKVSPVAAKLADEYEIDLTSIDAKGRIMKNDVLKAAGALTKNANALLEDKKVAASNMRKVISRRMSESWKVSPRVVYNMEVDVTAMKEFREKLKDEFKNEGVKLSYNHILMKVLGKALSEFPYINASFDGEEITLHSSINVGLAVDVEGGLIVPNVKNVQDKSLLDIAIETEALIENAKENKLSQDDMSGGTFTITNLGMFGMDSFSPIINQPELAILGVNRIVDKPMVINGEVTIRPIMNLNLTADHRVIDGAMAARFLKRVKNIIENPFLLLM